MSTLVLASASPRRRQLLEAAGLRFTVRPADLDETPHRREHPERYVERLARQKAAAVAAAVPRGVVVLAADTTVDVDGASIGKPVDAADARRILRSLSGRTHRVHTGVALVGGGTADAFTVTTQVRFTGLSDAAIDWYVATGEPMDVAGAYAIQGSGGSFVVSIEGSWSNVVGLPLAETLARLAAAGVAVPAV